MKLTNEPTLEAIDDYNNNETPEKRKMIRLIIIGLLVFAGVNGFLKYKFNTVSDYIGTPNNPGIEVGRR